MMSDRAPFLFWHAATDLVLHTNPSLHSSDPSCAGVATEAASSYLPPARRGNGTLHEEVQQSFQIPDVERAEILVLPLPPEQAVCHPDFH
jgi:hypothetical protein